MKKLLTLVCILLASQITYAQFTATLSGYPLVTTGWNIGGYGTVVDSTVRLTSAGGTQNGYVYYGTPINLTSCGQFIAKFDFKIVNSAASSAADGIAFWYIANPPSGFISGGGIGLPANPNGIIMILDTYDNDGDGNNPSETLLGYNGSLVGYTEGVATGVLPPVVGNQYFIDDGAWHHCELDYNAGNIKVYFNYSAVPSLTGYYPLSITGYFGLSASTGASYSTHSVKNFSINAAGVSLPPTVTSPLTYCQYAPALPLTATGTGGTISWFTTDTATVVALPGAPTPNTSVIGTTTYYVRQGSGTCISAPDSIVVHVIAGPSAPVITGDTFYCAGEPFTPFSITATGSVQWYNTSVGGVGSGTSPVVNTAVPGLYTYWASQTASGCESARDSIHVRVRTTPPAPVVTGPVSYCYNVGPVVPLTVTTTATGAALWYPYATGGTGSATAPVVNIAVVGTTNSWVSQVDSACESPRTPVVVTVHAKPSPPGVAPVTYCQYLSSVPVTASGSSLVWYGPGITPGTATAPVPVTTVAGVDTYYVTQTSSFGCISDSAMLRVTVNPQPLPPVVADTTYCQFFDAPALTAIGSNLGWYTAATGGTASAAPVPPTTTPGINTWYAIQTVNGCESPRVPLNVTTLYLPQFTITPSSPWVCLHDSITLSFTGAPLTGPGYTWTLPGGTAFAAGSLASNPSITVRFDIDGNPNVQLSASDYGGACSASSSIHIRVVPLPVANAYIHSRVCLGDSVMLALAYVSSSATNFTWQVDNTPMINSPAVTIISSAGVGGPFVTTWLQTGIHIIQLNSFSIEGCTSDPTFDTVEVRNAPDPGFVVSSKSICLNDSVQFVANTTAQECLYSWEPMHSFNNVNAPAVWGVIDQNPETVTLTITDAYGCKASSSQLLDPNTCCKVFVPSAFTPNGDSRNDVFHPLFSGYHHFHTFRIANRWGQIVFETTSSEPAWDGTYNGIPQDMGTYYYYLQYDCGNNILEQSGDVSLIR